MKKYFFFFFIQFAAPSLWVAAQSVSLPYQELDDWSVVYENLSFPKYKGPLKYGFSLSYDVGNENYMVGARMESDKFLEVGDVVLKINGEELPKNPCDLKTFTTEHFSKKVEILILKNEKKLIRYKIPDGLM